MHSMRLNEKLLQPWVIISQSGVVVSAHCDCMAGLAETCTHVGALLFKIEAVVRVREKATVTGVPAYWMIPSSVNKVLPEVGFKIDYTSAAMKRKTLDKLIDGQPQEMSVRTSASKESTTPVPTKEETDSLLRDLYDTGDKAAILTIMPEYCAEFEDPVEPVTAPKSLRSLRNSKCDEMDYQSLVKHCADLFPKLNVTDQQATKIERQTRNQTKCSAWYAARVGRVTASQLHAVCHTSVDKPALNIISNVCYPERSQKTSVPATRWGNLHEDTARQQYTTMLQKEHVHLQVEKCGLTVNPDFPYMGSSPDGLVSCSCCGQKSGCLEIKCPFKHRQSSISEACKDKDFCLFAQDDKFFLKTTHPYYSQVQCQIFTSSTDYCDFAVWTEVDFTTIRIEPDHEFWASCQLKAEEFVKKVVLPELVAKHFTEQRSMQPQSCSSPKPLSSSPGDPGHSRRAKRPLSVSSRKNTATSTPTKAHKSKGRQKKPLWCYCRQPEEKDDMVACENENCEVEWFHLNCVGLNQPPSADDVWFCPTCVVDVSDQN